MPQVRQTQVKRRCDADVTHVAQAVAVALPCLMTQPASTTFRATIIGYMYSNSNFKSTSEVGVPSRRRESHI